MTVIEYIKELQLLVDKNPEVANFIVGYDKKRFKSATLPIVVKVDKELQIIDETSCIDVWGELPEYKNVVIL